MKLSQRELIEDTHIENTGRTNVQRGNQEQSKGKEEPFFLELQQSSLLFNPDSNLSFAQPY